MRRRWGHCWILSRSMAVKLSIVPVGGGSVEHLPIGPPTN